MEKNNVLEFISFLGSCASLISVLFLEVEWNILKIVLVILLAILCSISIYMLFLKKDNITCKSQQKINDFMKDWIRTEGVVEILSRDLSWVDDEMVAILASKGKDLNIYVENKNTIIDKIKATNTECKIFYYNEFGFTPKSRFTIVRANKDERQIAIAIKEEKGYKKIKHCIYISKGSQIDKKILVLANDLLQALRCKGKAND